MTQMTQTQNEIKNSNSAFIEKIIIPMGVCSGLLAFQTIAKDKYKEEINPVLRSSVGQLDNQLEEQINKNNCPKNMFDLVIAGLLQ